MRIQMSETNFVYASSIGFPCIEGDRIVVSVMGGLRFVHRVTGKLNETIGIPADLYAFKIKKIKK